MHQKTARFRDMRPPKTDTNLYTYHLNQMVRFGYVEKIDEGYTLGVKGILYADRVSSETVNIRRQPKIITMLVVQNSYGEILMVRKKRQPFIDKWNLPQGKIHIEDSSTREAAEREVHEKLQLASVPSLEHAGECYIRMRMDERIVMTTLAHIFRFETDAIQETDRLKWMKPHKLSEMELAPAVEQIVARTFFRDPYFFEEYTIDW